jgi:hypothetical protein
VDGTAAGIIAAGVGGIIAAGGAMALAGVGPITDMDIIIPAITAAITATPDGAIVGIGGIADGATVAGITAGGVMAAGAIIADGDIAVDGAITADITAGNASYESL